MINRWIGIAALGLMLSVNAALLVRDVFPDWFAGQPPESHALHLAPGDEINTQVGIFDGEGRRIACSWTRSARSDDLIMVRHRTAIRPLRLPHDVAIPALRLDTDLNYHGQASLDHLRVRVYGLDIHIELEGEAIPPDDFACRWQVGERRGEFVFPVASTRAIGDPVRPFESLTGLQVGRSWRVKLLNPLAGIIPGWGERHMLRDTMLVRVTGVERVEYRGETVEAFVVEADGLRAWVGPSGRVMRYELELPLFGTLTLIDEPFDEEMRREVLEGTMGR